MKNVRIPFKLILPVFLLAISIGKHVQAQTEIISSNSIWKYLDNGSNQYTNWQNINFNDGAWLTGNAELGYGDSPSTTIAKNKIGYYFRKEINISNPIHYSDFTMRIRRDDGIVVYMNNSEVYRNNMPTGIISYNTKATSACSDDGNKFFYITLPNSIFINGNNIIAAEVHNNSTSSSDITFELKLTANPLSQVTCSIPNKNSFGISNLTTTSATIFWDDVPDAQSYNFHFRDTFSNAPYSLPINVNSNAITLNNLQPGTTYEYIIQSVCSANMASILSSNQMFTTLSVYPPPSCGIPDTSQLVVYNITATSATINWEDPSDALSYNVKYKIFNSASDFSGPFNISLASFTFSNLLPSTNYEYVIQSVCANNELSDYTYSKAFITSFVSGSSAILLRGPYMTLPTSTGITVQWRTNITTNSELKYGTDPFVLNYSENNSGLVNEHSITLDGLLPNTKYYYSIGVIGYALHGDTSNYFYTAPLDNNAQPVKFWVTGDFGNGSGGQAAVRNSFQNYTSGQIVNGWLWLGDNAYSNGTDMEYQAKVFDVYKTIFKNIPVFPAPGNHDYAQSGYQSPASLGVNFPYFNIFTLPTGSGTEKYYSTNYSNIHFISLDSYGSYNNSSSAMYNWLVDDLANNTQQWTIVYFHHPPYTKGSHNSDTEAELIDMRRNIIPLLESYGVDLVLSGHSHIYERSSFIKNHTGLENTFNSSVYPAGNIIQPGSGPYTKSTRTGNGTVYVVCGVSGQAGVGTSSGYPHNAMFKSIINSYGSLILDVVGDSLTCKFLTSTGSINDQFTIIKQVPFTNGNTSRLSGTGKTELSNYIYPNPTAGEINIRINNPDEIVVSISIYNPDGNMVYQNDYLKKNNADIKIEHLKTNLKPGVYFISVKGDNINTSDKLIIF